MSGRRILFAGTPAFALASLRALCESGVLPLAVYTQPDRPAGRGKKLKSSPVKEYAQGQNIEIRQPESLKDKDVAAEIAEFDADLMIVAAYGLILPQAILDLPRQGCLNVHASLLPRWRGAAPIQAAILADDEETGISLMQMTAGLDSGPVVARQSLQISDTESAGELHDRLALLGGEMLCEHLAGILEGNLEAVAQDERAVSVPGPFSVQRIATLCIRLQLTASSSRVDLGRFSLLRVLRRIPTLAGRMTKPPRREIRGACGNPCGNRARFVAVGSALVRFRACRASHSRLAPPS